MRLPFPIHIPLQRVVFFASLLFGVQLIQGTAPEFAIYSFLFVVTAGAAFNVAGGFSRPSGAYVFFYSILAVIFGLIWKAVLNEPADSNLVTPLLTIRVFLGGIVAMLISVIISKKLTLRKPLLGNLVTDANMQNATVGCMVTGLVVMLIRSPRGWRNSQRASTDQSIPSHGPDSGHHSPDSQKRGATQH